MTTSNTSAPAPIQNNTSNKEILSKVNIALADSISLAEVLQSTSLITPRGQSLQLDHLELQGVSVITNDLITKLEFARVLIDENSDAYSFSSEFDELMFESMALIAFVQIFPKASEQLSGLHTSQLSGLFFVTQRAVDCIKESQALIESSLQDEKFNSEVEQTGTTNKDKAENAETIAIPQKEFPRFIWKLKHIGYTLKFLQEELLNLKSNENGILLTSAEVSGFDAVLHESNIDLHSLSNELKDSGSPYLVRIGSSLGKTANHADFLLGHLFKDTKYNEIYRNDLESFSLLLGEVWDSALLASSAIEKLASDGSSKTEEPPKGADSTADYINLIIQHLTVLYPRFIRPGGHDCESDLFSDPGSLRNAVVSVRDSSLQLSEGVPVESELAMDARLAADQLGFLIRLIDSKFKFQKSDLIAVSQVVDECRNLFTQIRGDYFAENSLN